MSDDDIEHLVECWELGHFMILVRDADGNWHKVQSMSVCERLSEWPVGISGGRYIDLYNCEKSDVKIAVEIDW